MGAGAAVGGVAAVGGALVCALEGCSEVTLLERRSPRWWKLGSDPKQVLAVLAAARLPRAPWPSRRPMSLRTTVFPSTTTSFAPTYSGTKSPSSQVVALGLGSGLLRFLCGTAATLSSPAEAFQECQWLPES